ncbi:MAG: M23 family metallopeptidase [Chitinophagales bacterium]|nr:M23 family metallopeptidase [Chitinophagales bacterium]
MRTSIIIATLFLLAFTQQSEAEYPQHYFQAPINGALRLSGTFGELRPQHFHAGLDIKGYVGQPLLAAAAGYVSRIKVGSGGYGKVLYISHPNGYTSVYAHMNRFTPALEQYVKQEQYLTKSFEIELHPTPGQFEFQKGEKIGEIGITGRSFGPHVHFEIRDTPSGQPINPLLFGLPIGDHRPPQLHQLKLYQIGNDGSCFPGEVYNLRKQNRKAYRLSGKDTLLTPYTHTGIAVKTFDLLDAAPNLNGIFELLLYQNDSLLFHVNMETFQLSQMRYLNAHLDYRDWKGKGAYFNRCYRLPGNHLEHIYLKDQGIISLSQNEKVKLKVIAKDQAGNESSLTFWLKRSGENKTSVINYNYFLPQAEANGINATGIQLRFPKNTFYQDAYFDYAASYENSYGIYSLIHHLHDPAIPVHKYFEIALKPNQSIEESLKDKAFIVYCDEEGNSTHCGGEWKKGWLYAKVRALGAYSIMIDEEAPTIQPLSIKHKVKTGNRFQFLINDQLATASNVKSLSYEGYIDGKWVLFTYDEKNELIEHVVDGNLEKGEHTLLLTVKDASGNTSSIEHTFLVE